MYLAGYSFGACPGKARVTKTTPDGLVWVWTDDSDSVCSGMSLAATPDGGAILTRSGFGGNDQVGLSHAASVGPAGELRWRQPLPVNEAYFGPVVDTNGVVVLPRSYRYECGSRQCVGIDKGRVYVTGNYSGPPPLPVAAFDVSGLGDDYSASADWQQRTTLAGFSQGAHIIQSVLERLDASAVANGVRMRESIAGVALLASTRFDSDDAANRGHYVADYPNDGIARGSKIRERFQRVTSTYCQAHDQYASSRERTSESPYPCIRRRTIRILLWESRFLQMQRLCSPGVPSPARVGTLRLIQAATSRRSGLMR